MPAFIELKTVVVEGFYFWFSKKQINTKEHNLYLNVGCISTSEQYFWRQKKETPTVAVKSVLCLFATTTPSEILKIVRLVDFSETHTMLLAACIDNKGHHAGSIVVLDPVRFPVDICDASPTHTIPNGRMLIARFKGIRIYGSRTRGRMVNPSNAFILLINAEDDYFLGSR